MIGDDDVLTRPLGAVGLRVAGYRRVHVRSATTGCNFPDVLTSILRTTPSAAAWTFCVLSLQQDSHRSTPIAWPLGLLRPHGKLFRFARMRRAPSAAA